jgi:hypothetical protein
MLDQEKYKNKKVTLKIDDNGKDEMSYYELSRWMSLIEAVEHVGKKCDQLGVPKNSSRWIKPIALQKYVDERTEGMLFELTNQGKV